MLEYIKLLKLFKHKAVKEKIIFTVGWISPLDIYLNKLRIKVALEGL